MAKIKLTKGELKKQRDSLKQFRRYLPTLILKKQQLQMKILEVKTLLAQRQDVLDTQIENIEKWAGLLADPNVDLLPWLKPQNVITEMNNIAGANVEVFKEAIYPEAKYDYYETPFWIDEGLKELRIMVNTLIEIDFIKKQIAILEKELRTTTQRVNLFEKVKIPECRDKIRKIGIYLGDQQANAVGVSKVAKKKVDAKSEEFDLAMAA